MDYELYEGLYIYNVHKDSTTMQPTVLLVENTGLLETWDERDEEAATNQ
jgi:hypothetical protein